MKIAYFDCFSGAAGDMILAALHDAGCPLTVYEDVIRRLDLPGVAVAASRVKRHGLAATHIDVTIAAPGGHGHRHLAHILRLINAAGLPDRVAANARRVFQRLAEAEATVHQTSVEKVHFHEVGADDAIVDIVGACAALDALGIDRVVCSPIPTGTGTVRCDHGVMPVPAPATALLLRGVPLAECDEPGELTTPTGAALLATLADDFGPLPALRLAAVGCGTGTREGRTRPNLLRVLIGESSDEAAGEQDVVTVLEAQVDDAPGQVLAHVLERALAAGALDAFIVPIIMKKGRPGQLLTVLCRAAHAAALETLLLTETTTFGVRRHECRRTKLAREHTTVATEFGPVRVKLGRRGDTRLQAWPEFEDCAALADSAGVPLREVQAAALRALPPRDEM
jgi:uncharacterized protein (TIGR00299 family) protein